MCDGESESEEKPKLSEEDILGVRNGLECGTKERNEGRLKTGNRQSVDLGTR
jgi:hypothetical protein